MRSPEAAGRLMFKRGPLTQAEVHQRSEAGRASAAARHHGETNPSVRQGGVSPPSRQAVGLFRAAQARPGTRATRGVWDTRTTGAPIGAMNASFTFHFPKAYRSATPDPAPAGHNRPPPPKMAAGEHQAHQDVVITNPQAIVDAHRHPEMRAVVQAAIGVVRDHQKGAIERGIARGLIPEGTSPSTASRAYKHAALRALHKAGLGDYDTRMDDAAKAEFTPLVPFMRYASRRVFDVLNTASLKGKWQPFRDEFGQLYRQKKFGQYTGHERMRMRPVDQFIKLDLGDLDDEVLAKAEKDLGQPEYGSRQPEHGSRQPKPGIRQPGERVVQNPSKSEGRFSTKKKGGKPAGNELADLVETAIAQGKAGLPIPEPPGGVPPIAGAHLHMKDASAEVERHFEVRKQADSHFSGEFLTTRVVDSQDLSKGIIGDAAAWGARNAHLFTGWAGRGAARGARASAALTARKLPKVAAAGAKIAANPRVGAAVGEARKLGAHGLVAPISAAGKIAGAAAGGARGARIGGHVGLAADYAPVAYTAASLTGLAGGGVPAIAGPKFPKPPIPKPKMPALSKSVDLGFTLGSYNTNPSTQLARAMRPRMRRRLPRLRLNTQRHLRTVLNGGITRQERWQLGASTHSSSFFKMAKGGGPRIPPGADQHLRPHGVVPAGHYPAFGPASRTAQRPADAPILRKRVTEREVRAAARDIAKPTEGQARVGNYRKAHINISGLDVTLENAKGSIRRGVNKATGKPWQVKLPAHYGYVKRTTGADGDHVDVYVGPHTEDAHGRSVYVVHQHHIPSGRFDEHKCMVGFRDKAHALATYDAGFSDGRGPERRKSVHEVTFADFRKWVGSEDSTKPMAKGLGSAALRFARTSPKTAIAGGALAGLGTGYALKDSEEARAGAGAVLAGSAVALASRGHALGLVRGASRKIYTTGLKNAVREHARVFEGGTPSPHMEQQAKTAFRAAKRAALQQAMSARQAGRAGIRSPKNRIAGSAAIGGAAAAALSRRNAPPSFDPADQYQQGDDRDPR